MASRFSFRQHLLLLLFLDILILMFIGVSSDSSFLINFINVNEESGLKLDAEDPSNIYFIILALVVGISAIGVTSGSNFAGVQGILSGVIGIGTKAAGIAASSAVIAAVMADYIMVYNFMIDGSAFGLLNIVAMLIFFPLIIDALFASIDWVRGTNT